MNEHNGNKGMRIIKNISSEIENRIEYFRGGQFHKIRKDPGCGSKKGIEWNDCRIIT